MKNDYVRGGADPNAGGYGYGYGERDGASAPAAGDRHPFMEDNEGKDAGDGPGYAIAEVDLAEADKARGMIAALRHDRDFTLDAAPARQEAAAS